MIIGIGTDIVEIKRFKDWHTFDVQKLQKIFGLQEIEYAFDNIQLSSQRFAVRFAAKEAFFKAVYPHLTNRPCRFYTLARHVTVVNNEYGSPDMSVEWDKIPVNYDPLWRVHVSLSHSKEIAIATIVIEIATKK